MLLESLKRLARSAVELVETRLELLSLDLEEARLRLLSTLLVGAAALFCVTFGVAMGAFWLVAAFWDTHRLLVLGLLTGGFVGGGLLALALLAWRLRRAPRLLAGTLAELERDRAALGGRR